MYGGGGICEWEGVLICKGVSMGDVVVSVGSKNGKNRSRILSR